MKVGLRFPYQHETMLRTDLDHLVEAIRTGATQTDLDVAQAAITTQTAILAALQVSFEVEHASDGGHGSVTLDGALTLSTLTPPQITADQNDYAPTNGMNRARWRVSSDAAWNITGVAGGVADRVISLQNIGAQNLVLVHESGASAAANRFNLPAGLNITLGQYSGITMVYDGPLTRWLVDRV